ncbi:hypothetical protein MKK84_21165 [Methylobacterium sp. E-065]|uniref:hypothetical protein n=1 Tax=Methylobacterium sp. E-065 TaxID=2836583 RepID=UPI001FB9FF7C|nr:hypothetical protein [Methylobacterium sp. E-065]MCJ2019913.1 hypothetical protein [Methylobacterium sp. E-065]
MSPRSKNPELPENVVLLRPDVVVRRAVGRPKRPRRISPEGLSHLSLVTPLSERPGPQPLMSSNVISHAIERARLQKLAAIRRDIGHQRSASKLPAEPVETFDAEGYVWPGSRPQLWEEAYRDWGLVRETHPYLRLYPAHAFTRDVFLVWIAGNVLADAAGILRERYPGFDDPECDEPPAAALVDPIHRRIEVLEQPRDRALRRIRSDRAAYDLWRGTLRRFPEIRTLPQDWAHVFRSLDRTNQRR